MERESLKQIRRGILILILIVVVGTIGYELIEPDFGFLDAVYMTIISMSTTGFHEVKPLSDYGRIFTMFIIISGIMTIAYLGGKGAQLIIEREFFRRKRMTKKIARLKDHYIVCGYGRMGKVIVEGLEEHRVPFIIIENSPEKVKMLTERNYFIIEGDATNDEILIEAGVERARGLVSVVQSDSDNVFTVLSARELNPDLFIVARAIDENTAIKLRKAGANRVVNPYELGGSRLLYLLLKPSVMDFIDGVARSNEYQLNLEEVTISESSPLVGKSLSESPIREELNIIIVAIHRKDRKFIYNPRGNVKLEVGDKLIAIGEKEHLLKLDNYCFGKG